MYASLGHNELMVVEFGSNRWLWGLYRIDANLLVKNVHRVGLNEPLMPLLSIMGGGCARKYDKFRWAVVMLRSLDAYTAQSLVGTSHGFLWRWSPVYWWFALTTEILLNRYSLLVNGSQQVFPMPQRNSCAKYCSSHSIRMWMRANWIFYHVWKIVCEKGLSI